MKTGWWLDRGSGHPQVLRHDGSAHLRELLRRRVRDGVLLRLIDKWLNAGRARGRKHHASRTGITAGRRDFTASGQRVPALCAGQWFEQEVRPRLKGQAFLIRYADDFVIGFTCEEDARRVLEVLPKRFGKYGLTIHPDKTRLVAFQPPASLTGTTRTGSPGTFDLLGFTHFWCRSRKGNWVVKRRTAGGRLRRAIGDCPLVPAQLP